MGRMKEEVLAERLKLVARIIEKSSEPISSKTIARRMEVSRETARLLLLKLAATGKYASTEIQGLVIWPKKGIA